MVFRALAFSMLLCSGLSAAEKRGFLAPLSIPVGRPGPVTVNWGDFDGDSKLDLVVANGVASNEASGSPSIQVLFQDQNDRQSWKTASLPVGSSAVYVRGADMNHDSFDDILVADVAQSAFFLKSKGASRTFEAPKAIPQASGARWIAVADFDNDGHLDFASSNFRASNLTVFLGDGTGNFTLSVQMPGHREHVLEALDFDGDFNMDIVQGSGLPGITPFRGNGDGTFDTLPNVGNLGCIEYISEVGHYDHDLNYVLEGDYNSDGLGDLAVTCIDDNIAYAGVSKGDGAYTRALSSAAGSGTESTAIGDFNGDEIADVAMVSMGDTKLWIHVGRGNGTFEPASVYGPTGQRPVFLVSQDLDSDGYRDVISADNSSSTVTVFWGQEGPRLVESGSTFSGFSTTKGLAVADVDRDGYPDLLFPRGDVAVISIYKKAGLGGLDKPSQQLALQDKYSVIETADLDGDGITDVFGSDLAAGNLLVALLDSTAKAKTQLRVQAGISPVVVRSGQFDGGGPLDIAVVCKGSNHVALFFGLGEGAFSEPSLLPVLAKPKALAVGRFAYRSPADLIVVGDTEVNLHPGLGSGEYGPAEIVIKDQLKFFVSAAVGDVDGDGRLDLALGESKKGEVLWLRSRGDGTFDAPKPVKPSGTPTSITLADIDRDGRVDIIVSSNATQSVSAFYNEGAGVFGSAMTYGLGLNASGHRVADLNLDGVLDFAAYTTSQAVVLPGVSNPGAKGQLRRGDSNVDGLVNMGDPLRILDRLFGGGPVLKCDDAGDVDDDGALGLADAISLMAFLFGQGNTPDAPGPSVCGPDPTADALLCQSACP